MGPLLYDITSAWPGKTELPDVIGQKFLATLTAIDRASPYRDWETSGENAYAIKPLHDHIGDFVSSQVFHDDYGRPDAAGGYLVGAVARVPGAASARFCARAGSQFRNFSNFEIGSGFNPPESAMVTFPIFKAALLAMITIWPAPWANTQCSIWGQKPPTLPGEAPFPYSGFQMPWISYLNAERAAKVDAPSEIKTERTPDGGLLMIAAETRFDPTKVEHMRPSRLMAQIMIEHGGKPAY